MGIKKQVKVALAVAVSSSLVIPGYVLAAEKPAQPGTVRPADKAAAQPGTDKKARTQKKDAESKEPASQAGTEKTPQKPANDNAAPGPAAAAKPSAAAKPETPAAQPASESKPSTPSVRAQEPSAPAPAPNYSNVTDQGTVPKVRAEDANAAAPVQPAAESKPSTPSVRAQEPSAPAPAPNYSNASNKDAAPSAAQQATTPVESAGGQTLAEQATETTGSQTVRESARGIKQEDEAQPVRTTQADEKARFEVASAVETDGDVRQDATREEAAITREEEKTDLAPAQVPDDGPDGDDEDTPEPINNALDQTISAGASVEGEQGNAEVEFDASPEATTFSANAADTTVNATVDHVGKQVTVEAGDAEFQVQAPAAVEEILPPQVAQSVDQAAQQAQAAVNTHLESLPSGEQVSETAIGQVTTWLDVH